MIWVYSVTEKDFVATDVTSLSQLMELAANQWVWVDIFDPSEKELEIITELIGNESGVVEKLNRMMGKPLDIRLEGRLSCDYERVHEYTLVTIPSIYLEEQLLVYTIVLAKKKRMIITWGQEGHNSTSWANRVAKRIWPSANSNG